MDLFPNSEFKKFSKCSNGDFLYITMGENLYAGICIVHGTDYHKLLVLEPGVSHVPFDLVEIPPSKEVQNLGADWRLSPGKISAANDATFRNIGAVLHSSEGTFVIASDALYAPNDLFCRVDEAEVRYPADRPRGCFAYENWSIEIIDEKLNERLTLFSKGKAK